MKVQTKLKIAIIFIITLAIMLIAIIFIVASKFKENNLEVKSNSIISPASDYVDYEPLENISDSTAMILQEMRCDK